MALQGTLETFAVGDVLRLLASTRKTGRLRVSSNRGSGSVWIDEGRLRAAAATSAPVGAPMSDVLFQLLRHRNGSFAFEPDVDFAQDAEPSATVSDPAADVVDQTAQAEELLSEWRTIEQVVPSLDAIVTLAAQLPEEPFAISASQWRTVREIGRGCSVAELGLALVEDEVAVSRTVKALVDAQLVDVQVNVQPPAPASPLLPLSAWDTPAPIAESPETDHREPLSFGSAASESSESLSFASAASESSEPHSFASTASESGPLPAPSVGYPPPARNDLPTVFTTTGREGSDPWASSGNGHRADSPNESATPGALPWVTDAAGNGNGAADQHDADGAGALEPSDEPAHDAAALLDAGDSTHPHADGRANEAVESSMTPARSEADSSVDLGIAIPGVPSITSFVGRVRDLVRGESHAGAAQPAAASPMAPAPTPGEQDTTQVPVTASSAASSESESFDLGTLTPSAARAIALAAQASTDEERDAALAQAVGPDDQPMDRRVLLRFLSSVKQ